MEKPISNRILDDMRDVMQRRHYSIRIERSYCKWVKRSALLLNMTSHDELCEREKKAKILVAYTAINLKINIYRL